MKNSRRIAVIVVICAGILLGNLCGVLFPPAPQLEARNTTVMTTGVTQKPAVTCGVMGCTGYVGTGGQSVRGGGHSGSGGGTIHIGS